MKIAAFLATLAIVCVLYARQQHDREVFSHAAAADVAAVIPAAPALASAAGGPAHSVYRSALDSANATAEQVKLQRAGQEKDVQ